VYHTFSVFPHFRCYNFRILSKGFSLPAYTAGNIQTITDRTSVPAAIMYNSVIFKDMGMSLTTAVNIFLKQAVREQGIPFYVGQPKYKEEVYQAMRDVEQGKNLSKSYRSAKEMIEDILKDE